MADFLLEIGVEELPARFVGIALEQLCTLCDETLAKCGIASPELHRECWGTPRRLVLYLSGLPPISSDRIQHRLGPPWEKAFMGSAPTPQALGFAQKFGVPVESLKRIETPRGVFAGIEIREPGLPTPDLLKKELPPLLQRIHFPKTMRWDEGIFPFARPVRWVLALWENEPLLLEIAGVPTVKASPGPRFDPRAISIPHAREYLSRMRKAGVMIRSEERLEYMKKRSQRLAKKNALEILWDEELLKEIVYLTEWPEPQLGSFPSRYLRLPEIVIKTVLKDHQRCFIVKDQDHHLAPHFLFVMNRKNDPQGLVKKGNERVVKARLEDAWFYFCEDLGIPVDCQDPRPERESLARMESALKTMTFLEGMGTMADRKERIRSLSLYLCKLLPEGMDSSIHTILEKALNLYLADLGSKMIYEYPELAGWMTPIYARLSGAVPLPQGETTLLALKEANLPGGEPSSLPQTVPGYLLALSQRLDTLFAHAYLHHFPSGTHDPFGMKTVADEILSLLLTPPPEIAPHVARWGPRISGEKDLSHSLLEHWMTLLKEARISGKDNHTVLPSGLTSFLKDRLSAILVQKGFPSPWVRGAVDTLHFNPLQAFQRLNALKEWAHSHDLVSLLDTYKRFRNIARDVEMPDILSTPRFFEATEGVEPGERAFAETLIQTGSKLMNLLESHPLQALTLLGDLVPVAEGLFQTVRIEHPDPVLRRRRKSVVAFARALFLRYINWDRLLEG